MTLAWYKKLVVTVTESETVTAVAQKLRDSRVGCVVVLTDGRPAGIITDRDLAIRIVADGRDPSATRASDIVTYDPITCEESESVLEAVEKMRKHGVRRLPVVDGRGALVGIVTANDLIVDLGRQLGAVAESLATSADTTDSR